MEIKCVCGNMLNDEKAETCKTYSLYDNEEYYELLDSSPKTVAELVDKMPLSGIFWKCSQCGRIYWFKNKKIDCYFLESEKFYG